MLELGGTDELSRQQGVDGLHIDLFEQPVGYDGFPAFKYPAEPQWLPQNASGPKVKDCIPDETGGTGSLTHVLEVRSTLILILTDMYKEQWLLNLVSAVKPHLAGRTA